MSVMAGPPKVVAVSDEIVHWRIVADIPCLHDSDQPNPFIVGYFPAYQSSGQAMAALRSGTLLSEWAR